jgi:fatty acid desaturase
MRRRVGRSGVDSGAMEQHTMEATTIDWYRTPVDKEVLKRLTRKSDLRGLLQAGSFLLVVAGTTTAAVALFARGLWIPLLIVCYLHSVFFNFLSMAAAVHELSHGTVFRSRVLNEAFYLLFSFLTWNNPVHFRASHMFHHQLTVFRGRDKEVIQGRVAEKLNWVNTLSWLTFDFRAFRMFVGKTILHALGKADVDFFFWDPLFAKDDPRRKAMCAWASGC